MQLFLILFRKLKISWWVLEDFTDIIFVLFLATTWLLCTGSINSRVCLGGTYRKQKVSYSWGVSRGTYLMNSLIYLNSDHWLMVLATFVRWYMEAGNLLKATVLISCCQEMMYILVWLTAETIVLYMNLDPVFRCSFIHFYIPLVSLMSMVLCLLIFDVYFYHTPICVKVYFYKRHKVN